MTAVIVVLALCSVNLLVLAVAALDEHVPFFGRLMDAIDDSIFGRPQ